MLKPIIWIASTKDDLLALPEGVKDEIGHALYQAQKGGKSDKAKPFKGFGSAAVLEIVENNEGGTYRAVYTVKFQDIDLIKNRFRMAEQEYEAWLSKKKKI